MGLHIGTNAVLFALTAHHCSKVKGDIHRMQAQTDAGQTSRKKFLALRAKCVVDYGISVISLNTKTDVLISFYSIPDTS